MTRRERLERKIEKRNEWAAKADQRSDAAFAAVRRIADNIPFGQPILVGHHSEKRHRRDIDRIHNGMSKGCELAKLADHHESKAAGLADQLERAIFDDDPDAIEALEAKAAALDAKADRMKAENAIYRKKGAAGLAEFHGITMEQAERRHEEIQKRYSWERQPFPSYSLAYARKGAAEARKRIERIKARNDRMAETEAAGGARVVQTPGGWCYVQFAEKPPREHIDALKAAGFWWSKDRWTGKESDLPASVREFVASFAA